MRRNRTVRRHDVAVLLAQLHAHVGVQLEVERPHLIPQPIELLGELVGRHVVLRAPHRAGVGEAELARALVRQLDEPRVVLPHRRRDRVPALPTTSRSRFSSRDVAITFVTSSMFRHVSGLSGFSHHLPLPYVASSLATIFVSSSASFGSEGAPSRATASAG